jgi:gentisate 1,2-dioxygenase
MPGDKMIALVGPGSGPQMRTEGMPNLHARILNIKDGVVKVLAGEREFEFREAGVYPLPDSPWVSFSHDGSSRSLICTLFSRR